MCLELKDHPTALVAYLSQVSSKYTGEAQQVLLTLELEYRLAHCSNDEITQFLSLRKLNEHTVSQLL